MWIVSPSEGRVGHSIRGSRRLYVGLEHLSFLRKRLSIKDLRLRKKKNSWEKKKKTANNLPKTHFGNGSFLSWIVAGYWETSSRMSEQWMACETECDRLHRESVARLTVNRPVKSGICFQSSPFSSLQQLPWKPQCHFPPLFGPLDILKAFFSPCLLEAGKTDNERQVLRC